MYAVAVLQIRIWSDGRCHSGQWYHVAEVYDGATQTIRMYFNGTQTGSVSFAFSAGTTGQSLTLATPPEDPNTAFHGTIDDVRIYGGLLGASAISALANIPSAPATPPGLVAFYPRDGNGIDASGNGNNGTVSGATPAAGRIGQAGTALSFSGPGVVTVPTNPLLKSLTNDLTLVYWVKRGVNPIQNTMIPVSRREFDNRIHFLTYATPGGFGFQCCSGGSETGMFYVPTGSGLTSLNDGNWHQIAVTRRFGPSGFTQLYVDGIVVPGTYTSGAAPDPAPTIDADLLIGRQASLSNGQFQGFLDNVYLFNTILTQAQILALP